MEHFHVDPNEKVSLIHHGLPDGLRWWAIMEDVHLLFSGYHSAVLEPYHPQSQNLRACCSRART